MPLVAACCVLLVVLTTVVHYEVLRGLTLGLPAIHIPPRVKLIVVILVAFAAHAVEVFMYAVGFYVLGGHFDGGTLGGTSATSLKVCIYFSAETYTSLGYGDVLPSGPLRLLAGVEALNGLLLIGWSASYTYIAMERFWNSLRREDR